jgi:hypothetical protein
VVGNENIVSHSATKQMPTSAIRMAHLVISAGEAARPVASVIG